jgi:hypothetical protein
MQVFVNISSWGCFYSKELSPSVFTGWLELRWAPFLPRSQLLPGTGSILILSYTLQRWSLIPMRDQSLIAQPSRELRPHFLGVGPSQWSKPITVLLRDPADPPFCKSIFPYTHMQTDWHTGPHLYTMDDAIGRLAQTPGARSYTIWVDCSGWPL